MTTNMDAASPCVHLLCFFQNGQPKGVMLRLPEGDNQRFETMEDAALFAVRNGYEVEEGTGSMSPYRGMGDSKNGYFPPETLEWEQFSEALSKARLIAAH